MYRLMQPSDWAEVLALWQESRMNAFNSTPCTIAYDVGFETVSEIEVRSMELDGVDISESSSRVYPQGTTACHVIGCKCVTRPYSPRLWKCKNQCSPSGVSTHAP